MKTIVACIVHAHGELYVVHRRRQGSASAQSTYLEGSTACGQDPVRDQPAAVTLRTVLTPGIGRWIHQRAAPIRRALDYAIEGASTTEPKRH